MQGLVTQGIADIQASDDGSAIRFVLEQNDKPFFVEMPTANVEAILPVLISAVASLQSDDECTAIDVESVSVDVDQAGDVLLTFQNTGGARMSFRLFQSGAVQLSALLESALQHQSGSKSAH